MTQKQLAGTVGTPLENPFWERFAQNYSICLNATDSYMKARSDIGESKTLRTTAGAEGHKLLRKPEIQIRILELTDATAERLNISRFRVMELVVQQAYYDPMDIFKWDEDGSIRIRKAEDIPVELRRMIKSIKHKTRKYKPRSGDEVTESWLEVQLIDRQKAVEMLMRHLSLFQDKIDVSVTHDLGDVLAAAHQRVMRRHSQGAPGNVVAPGHIQDAEYREVNTD